MTNGSGPIIIRAMIDSGHLTTEQVSVVKQIEQRYLANGNKISWRDFFTIARLQYRLLR